MDQKELAAIQNRLLKVEKEQMESIGTKKVISEKANLNASEDQKDNETPEKKPESNGSS